MCGVSKQRVAQVCAIHNADNFQFYRVKACVYPNFREWLNKNMVSRSELIRRMGLEPCYGTIRRVSGHMRGSDYMPKIYIDRYIAVTGMPYEVLFKREDK